MARSANDARDVELRQLAAEVAELRAQVLRFQTAIDNVSHGVCFFDRSQRLSICNSRYAEIYRLRSEEIAPGSTLREIVERRFIAGTCFGTVEDYLEKSAQINANRESREWTSLLPDGRTIRVHHKPMPDGGWVSVHEDVTELQASRAIASERISLQNLIDLVPDYLWVKDVESRFIIANRALARDSGRARTSDMIGLCDADLHAPKAAQEFRSRELEILSTGRPMVDWEERVIDATGAERWFASTKMPLRDARGEIVGLVGIAHDVTARKLANALRDGQAEILEMIATSAPLDVVLERLVRLIETQVNGLVCSIMLLDDDGVHLRRGAAPSLPEDYCSAIDGIAIGLEAGCCGAAAFRREPVIVADIFESALWRNYRDLAGAHGLRSCWSTPILSSLGAALGVLTVYSKTVREPTAVESRLVEAATRIAGIAIERKLAQDRIQFMATHDALTGLPNRALLRDRLEQAILMARRYGRCATVAFIDLDNFKVINDSLGHKCGDELLKVIAQRMVENVRATDTVARLGGDEFVILFTDQPKKLETTSDTFRRIQAAIAEPILVDGHTLRVTSSIGAATFPDDAQDVDALLANADAAMYSAKESGRDDIRLYTPDLNIKAHEKFQLHEDLRNAIVRNEFALVYQPQVNLRTGQVFAVEALVRWNHPIIGQLSPARFIPLAEETGLIAPIGEWVLYEACRQNKAWQAAGFPPITVCVNVSARQFSDKNFPNAVAAALRANQLEAKYLELEITESLIMQNVDQAVEVMKELQALGIHLSIDDFGTGYSSLSALKLFPVARLKIDESFINNVPRDENDKAVATAVISLGQKLNLKVIAEGVETEEQVAFLREHQCDDIQGYHFSKPVSPGAIENMLLGTK